MSMTQIGGLLTLRSGKARVWNRPKGTTQNRMRKHLAILKQTGVSVFPLPPEGPDLLVSWPPPAGSLAGILVANNVRTYDLVPEITDL